MKERFEERFVWPVVLAAGLEVLQVLGGDDRASAQEPAPPICTVPIPGRGYYSLLRQFGLSPEEDTPELRKQLGIPLDPLDSNPLVKAGEVYCYSQAGSGSEVASPTPQAQATETPTPGLEREEASYEEQGQPENTGLQVLQGSLRIYYPDPAFNASGGRDSQERERLLSKTLKLPPLLITNVWEMQRVTQAKGPTFSARLDLSPKEIEDILESIRQDKAWVSKQVGGREITIDPPVGDGDKAQGILFQVANFRRGGEGEEEINLSAEVHFRLEGLEGGEVLAEALAQADFPVERIFWDQGRENWVFAGLNNQGKEEERTLSALLGLRELKETGDSFPFAASVCGFLALSTAGVTLSLARRRRAERRRGRTASRRLLSAPDAQSQVRQVSLEEFSELNVVLTPDQRGETIVYSGDNIDISWPKEEEPDPKILTDMVRNTIGEYHIAVAESQSE